MNVEALKELAAKVEAGTLEPQDYGRLPNELYAIGYFDVMRSAFSAYNGSLDAAKALHDAVLPGWWWVLGSNSTSVYKSKHDDMISCGLDGMPPARRWLLAILRALISQAQNTTEGGAT